MMQQSTGHVQVNRAFIMIQQSTGHVQVNRAFIMIQLLGMCR